MADLDAFRERAAATSVARRTVARAERPLKIHMIGQRGVPATWGGIERHVEEVGARLAARGHEVVVYSRDGYADCPTGTHRGMTVVPSRALAGKHAEAFSHSASATVAALRRDADVYHFHAMGPGLFTPLPRFLARGRVVQTIHGLDQDRAKWGRVARSVLGAGSWLSSRVPDATVVVGSHLAQWYAAQGRRSTLVIPNGVDAPVVHLDDSRVRRMGLEPGRYVLFVGRLTPEKQPHALLEAFRHVPGDVQLALVGGSSATEGYVASLADQAAADPRVRLLGYRHGDDLAALYSHAQAFCQPSALEGMPLTLLEAASYGLPCVVSDLPVHGEVLGPSGQGRWQFPVGDVAQLARVLGHVLASAGSERAAAAEVSTRVLSTYSWDDVAARTEALYQSLVDGWRLQRHVVARARTEV